MYIVNSEGGMVWSSVLWTWVLILYIWVRHASFENFSLISIPFEVDGGYFHISNQSEDFTHDCNQVLNSVFISLAFCMSNMYIHAISSCTSVDMALLNSEHSVLLIAYSLLRLKQRNLFCVKQEACILY